MERLGFSRSSRLKLKSQFIESHCVFTVGMWSCTLTMKIPPKHLSFIKICFLVHEVLS